MRDKIFIDSNILLYAFSSAELQKQAIAKDIILKKCTISTQVINEVVVNLIKKFKMSEDKIESFVNSCYARYEVETIGQESFLIASSLRKKYLLSCYDSMILSSAIESQCNIIYSEDMQHKLQIDSRLTIINPFNND